uniref:Uncharacterized protein n=1 Tax=Anguilla anguilla TaxID=7936 RepID=A0A0E9SA62_ANGAN
MRNFYIAFYIVSSYTAGYVLKQFRLSTLLKGTYLRPPKMADSSYA